MYIVYGNIYMITTNNSEIRITETNIKYRTNRIIELPTGLPYKTYHENYLVLHNCNSMYIFGKQQITLNDIPFTLNNNFHIVEKYLIMSSINGKTMLIYDINNNTFIEKNDDYCYCIIVSSNGRILFEKEDRNEIYESIADYINGNKRIITAVTYGYLNWLNDNKIINMYENEIKYFNLNNMQYEIEKIPLSGTYHFRVNSYVSKNRVIHIDLNEILIIEGMNVKTINNNFGINFYSISYDIFMDNKMIIYKLIDNDFIRFRFEYDIWRDDDKPEYIQYVIDVLMDCDLFPNEILNIVYQQLIIGI